MSRELGFYDKVKKKVVWIRHEDLPPPQPRVYIRNTTIPLTQHPVDGQWYDSSSKFRAVTKAHGYEHTDGERNIANKVEFVPPIEEYEADVKQAWAMIDSGTAPLTEEDKAICKRINEQIDNR